MRTSRTERAVFVLALLGSVVLCLGALLCIPMSNGADEPGHLDYAGYLHEHRSLPGIATLRHPQPTQQPFLYYAYVAVFRAFAPEPAASREPPCLLPYERRVVLERGPVPDPMRSQRTPPGSAAPLVGGIAPYIWRLSGIPLLVVVAWCVFRTASAACGGDRRAAALAAAAALLVPTIPVAFSTITNDQFAILFGSLGFAPIAIGAARGVLGPRRILGAGLLFGLGFLSKSTMAGAFTAAAFVVAVHAPRPLGARLRDLAILVAPSALGASWWYVSRILETGHTDFVLAVGVAHPHLLRAVAPDWLGYLDTLAGTLLSWVGLVGPAISPGNLFLIVGAALPVLVTAGSVAVFRSRSANRLDRVLAGAFLAGLVVLVALLLSGTTHSYLIHGRHLLNLVVPGTLAAVIAMRHLFGRRARQVLAAAITWFAAADVALLHGAIIPLFHAPRDRFTSPDLVAYVDAGAPSGRAYVERGAPRAEPTWAPRPEGTVVTDPEEVRLRVKDLDPAGAYVAWVRVHPLTREIEAQDFWADDLPLGGTVTPIGCRSWLGFTIPRAATEDGTVAIGAKAIARSATIAELLVTRLPLVVETPATVDGDRLRVTLRSPAPERLPPLAARARARSGGAVGEPRSVTLTDGRADLVIPLEPGLTGPLELVLTPELRVWADLKVAPLVLAPAERAVHPDSPGFDVVRIKEGTAPGTPVLRLLGMRLPPGVFRTRFLDERARPIGLGALALALAPGRTVDAAGATIDVTDGATPALACEVLSTGGGRRLIDRLQVLHAAPWVFDLGVGR